MGARVRRGHRRARARRPHLLRAALGAALRGLGRRRLHGLPDLVGARRRRPRRPLVELGGGRADVLAGRRPHHRHVRVLASARRRLHPLRPERQERVLGYGAGYFVPHVWLFSLGALLFLSRGLDDTTALLTAVAAGGVASALALLALTVDETDEPFANVYSAAVSIQNLFPRAPQRLLILARRRSGDRRARSRSSSAATSRSSSCWARFSFRSSASSPRTSCSGSPRDVRALERDRRLAGRIRALPVDPADRPGLVDGRRSPGCREPVRSPAARRCPRSHFRSACTRPYGTPMRRLGVVGLVSLDRIDGGLPRLGGAVTYAARAVRVLGRPAVLATKLAVRGPTAPARRSAFRSQPGPRRGRSPSSTSTSATTAASGSSELGEPFTPEEARAGSGPRSHGVDWVHAGALTRADFPVETLSELGRGRVLSLDGQALVRPAALGEVVLDSAYDPELLRHVDALNSRERSWKLSVSGVDEALARVARGARGGRDTRAGGRGRLRPRESPSASRRPRSRASTRPGPATRGRSRMPSSGASATPRRRRPGWRTASSTRCSGGRPVDRPGRLRRRPLPDRGRSRGR